MFSGRRASLAYWLVLCGLTSLSNLSVAEEVYAWQSLTIGDSHDWIFVGQPWQETGEGDIVPRPVSWRLRGDAYVGQRTTNDDAN